MLILADDLGWSQLGCYGSSFYETPNLDGWGWSAGFEAPRRLEQDEDSAALQYRALLVSPDGGNSPVLEEVSLQFVDSCP